MFWNWSARVIQASKKRAGPPHGSPTQDSGFRSSLRSWCQPPPPGRAHRIPAWSPGPGRDGMWQRGSGIGRFNLPEKYHRAGQGGVKHEGTPLGGFMGGAKAWSRGRADGPGLPASAVHYIRRR
ncbi:hypothetical protein GCM10017782_01270 [Deinococcus ficus]|nr:hypothetical protein GCM10017782_01270 [Deinococcus ficus]